jgi:hypothetical protein
VTADFGSCSRTNRARPLAPELADSGPKMVGMAISDSSKQTAPDLHELAARAAEDPSARAFVEKVKAGLADGSIYEELANQPDFEQLIAEHNR